METTYEVLIQGMMDQGYGCTDALLPPGLWEALRARALAHRAGGDLRPAGIGQGSSYLQADEIRSDEILWLPEVPELPEEKAFLEQVSAFSAYLNRTCYAGIRDAEFHYACYPAGSFYRRHRDTFQRDDRRRFSLICYLNPDWVPEDGGALVLYLPEGPVEVLPQGGRVVYFDSAVVEHEVLPAR
ncbi:MAG: 2OG-Fe(II) oxygenase, partial [Bacteroidetes bacterium]